jgi:hypothetical protein
MFPYQTNGTAVIETGSNAARYTLGKARDLGVFGPGHNEDTFQRRRGTNPVERALNQYAREMKRPKSKAHASPAGIVTDAARRWSRSYLLNTTV